MRARRLLANCCYKALKICLYDFSLRQWDFQVALTVDFLALVVVALDLAAVLVLALVLLTVLALVDLAVLDFVVGSLAARRSIAWAKVISSTD